MPEGEHAPWYVGVICEAGNGLVPLVDTQSGVQKNGYDFAVTDRADKEAVGRLLDYLTSEEYATLTEFGIEGYSYEVAVGRVQNIKRAFLKNEGITPRNIVIQKNRKMEE